MEYGNQFDPYTAELLELQRRRNLAQQQIAQGMDTGPVRHWSQGAARLVSSMLGNREAARVAEEMKAVAGRREADRAAEMERVGQMLAPGEGAPQPSRQELARAMLGMKNPRFQAMGVQMAMQQPEAEAEYTLGEGQVRFRGGKEVARGPDRAVKAPQDPEGIRLSRIANDPQVPEFERKTAAAILAKMTRAPAPAVESGTWAIHPTDPSLQVHSRSGQVRKVQYPEGVEPPKARAVAVGAGQKSVDQAFGKDYVEWTTSGFSDAKKAIDQLAEVSTALGKQGNLTGGIVGNIPRALRASMGSDSAAAQDAVEEVVQRNLRLILGAQFTQKEGERLIERAYNPRLDEKENKKRVDRLMAQIKSAANAKQEAAQYFEENGTLAGWKGRLWTANDFDPEGGRSAAKAPDKGAMPRPTSKAERDALPPGTRYIAPDGSERVR